MKNHVGIGEAIPDAAIGGVACDIKDCRNHGVV
jgi:hypothetical protein